MNPVYVVTDVEVDGPTPGENSMLSFDSVAIDADGEEIDYFQAVLAPLEGATADLVTMAWFKSQRKPLNSLVVLAMKQLAALIKFTHELHHTYRSCPVPGN